MSANTALAVSVGVLGAIATWLFLGPLGGVLAIWAAFIAWGCFFHCGGKEQGLQTAVLNNAAGAIIAGITLIVATMTGLADTMGLPVWAAICVGIGVAAMVLLANIPMFASIPAQVYGFASVVAYTLMKDAAGSLTAASHGEPRCRRHSFDDHRRGVWLCVRKARRHAGGRRARRAPRESVSDFRVGVAGNSNPRPARCREAQSPLAGLRLFFMT